MFILLMFVLLDYNYCDMILYEDIKNDDSFLLEDVVLVKMDIGLEEQKLFLKDDICVVFVNIDVVLIFLFFVYSIDSGVDLGMDFWGNFLLFNLWKDEFDFWFM